MNIALIGYGKMGKLLETIAVAKGHAIIARIDPHLATKAITADLIAPADICIDFSRPDGAISNLRACAALGKNVVIGTTGWEAQRKEAEAIVADSGIGCLHSANFSLGVNLFMAIVAQAAQLIGPFDDYDVAGYECHHNQKLDAPSGTAKALTEVLLDHLSPKKAFEFASIRCGSIPGTHTILFDSASDTITLTHQARNREGFARGAITAAEWLQNKQGWYTLQDLLEM